MTNRPLLRAGAALATLLLVTWLAACGPGGPSGGSDTFVPELPPVVEPAPHKPVPADTGLPGQWEPTTGLEPTGRLFVVETGEDVSASRGIVIVPGSWGVQEETRDIARQLSTNGVTVAIPDLYEGVVPQSGVAVPELHAGIDQQRAYAIIGAAVARVSASGVEVYLLGSGAGGSLAYEYAAQAGRSFGGVLLDAPSNLPDIVEAWGAPQAPVTLLFGSADGTFLPPARGQIESILDEAGVDARLVEIPGAGTELLEARNFGFSRAGRKLALEEIVAILMQDRAR
jgi:dienelactone hydrolase